MKTCKHLQLALAGMLTLGAFASCSETDTPQDTLSTKGSPVKLTTRSQATLAYYNDFAFKAFRNLMDINGETNMVFSPLSLSSDISMLANGLSGEGREQVLRAINPSVSLDDLNALNAELLPAVRVADPTATLFLNRAFWYDPKFNFNDTYLTAVNSFYGAETFAYDFDDRVELVKALDNWTSTSTSGKIPSSGLALGDIGRCPFVISDVTGFFGKWADKFDPSKTVAKPFTCDDGSTVDAMMMNAVLQPTLHKSDGVVTLTQVPFNDNIFSFDIIMPAEGVSLADARAHLDGDAIRNLLSDGTPYIVILQMPRFSLGVKSFDFSATLKSLGVTSIFLPSTYSFTAMYEEGNPQFASILQHSTLSVNEEGASAASATLATGGTIAPAFEIREVVVDRPFLFMIREISSGSILFMGQIADPTLD